MNLKNSFSKPKKVKYHRDEAADVLAVSKTITGICNIITTIYKVLNIV